jgi:hypothetical protein
MANTTTRTRSKLTAAAWKKAERRLTENEA